MIGKFTEWRRRLWSLVHREREDADMQQELGFHLDMETEKNFAAGMDPREARRRAHLRLGGMVPIEEAVRDARGVRAVSDMLRDIRLAVRSLRRSPLFTAVTVATLSIGIGATTVVYSFVDGVLLSPLAYRQPDRLMSVQLVIPELIDRYPVVPVSIRAVEAWGRHCETTCRELVAIEATDVVVTGGAPEPLNGVRASAGLFDLLRVEPLLGRTFQPEEDDDPDQPRVAVLTHGLWQRRFGGAPSALGRIIELDGRPTEVVGVLPASFRFPRFEDLAPIDAWSGQPQYFEPLTYSESQVRSPGAFNYLALMRLPPNVTPAQATVELTGILTEAFADAPFHPEARVEPMLDTVVGDARRPLWLLFGAVVAMLLVASVNVANMLGARWLERRRDLALRRALGASPRESVLRALRESLLLAAAGGLGGVVIAHLAMRSLLAVAPPELPRLDEVAVDGSVLAASFAITLVCGLLCAVVPAWQASRVDPMETLKIDNTPTRRQGPIPNVLVGLEVALGVGLLVVGGLLLTSFVHVMQIDRGFEVERILAADVLLPRTRYADGETQTAFYDRALRGLATAPGVRDVSLVQRLPLEGLSFIDTLARIDDTRPDGELPTANYRVVGPDYMRTMGLTITRGRMFTDQDRERRPLVINERAAQALWPAENPIGQLVHATSDDEPPRTIIGVVANARIVNIETDTWFVAYVPYWEEPLGSTTFVVRTETDPTTMTATLSEGVLAVDPTLAVHNVRTMERVLSDAVAGRRFQLMLIAGFGLAGLLLVALGVYGVVATTVERRRSEIAIHLALGATVQRVFRMVLGHAMRSVVLGVGVGVASAVLGGRAITAFLYEVAPHDWTVLSAASLIVVTVAVVACLTPIVRAVQTPTTILLKSE